jgi:hypothetical protein
MTRETTQLPVAYISHQMVGRLRLRIPARKGDPSYFDRVADCFEVDPDIEYVETNPLTASILIIHHTDSEALLERGVRDGLFMVGAWRDAGHSTAQRPLLSTVSAQINRADERVLRLTEGSMDLHELVFLGLVGAGALQILRGNLIGPASSLLANAATLLALHRVRRNSGSRSIDNLE